MSASQGPHDPSATPSASTDQPPAISLRELTLRIGTRTLLEKVSLEVPSGSFCLLVGPSGSGKTTLASLLSGLARPDGPLQASGEAKVLGQPRLPLRSAPPNGRSGVVFQDFALFDELDTRGNVRFGHEHGARSSEPAEGHVSDWLAELELPNGRRPAELSGGMKQRLAIARALAFAPELLFYDEPTSGLDPAMARRVAQLLRRTHDAHAMTSIVVTHDVEVLGPVADRILVLDPESKSIRIQAETPPSVSLATPGPKLLDAMPAPDLDAIPPAPSPSPWRYALWPLRATAELGHWMLLLLGGVLALIPRWPRAKHGLRFFWSALRIAALGSGLPFLATTGLVTGFIATYFLFALLPYRGFTEPVLAEEFVGSLGFASWRVLVPGVVTLLFAARSGAALAADAGGRSLTRQLDAMRSHGLHPERYLLTGYLLACLIGLPLCFVAAECAARAASLVVWLAQHPDQGGLAYFERHFSLLGGNPWLPDGWGWVLGKILVSAFGTALIAWHIGSAPKRSGREVAEGVTSVILRATLFVLFVQVVFALLEFAPMSS